MTGVSPKDELMEKLRNLKADLLVVGCRSQGKIHRATFGSFSDYCAHNSPVPVIVIKN